MHSFITVSLLCRNLRRYGHFVAGMDENPFCFWQNGKKYLEMANMLAFFAGHGILELCMHQCAWQLLEQIKVLHLEIG